jgi:hypothetical protein
LVPNAYRVVAFGAPWPFLPHLDTSDRIARIASMKLATQRICRMQVKTEDKA